MKFLKIIALAVMLICVVLTFASCKNKEETPPKGERFDYFAVENYGEYVSLDKSVYEGMKIQLEDKYTVGEEQVDEYIEYLLFNKKTVKNNGAKITGEPIKRGDTAYIFYKGVMLDEATGEYKEFKGGSNMDAPSPHELVIGSDSFIDGFEDGLIGVIPSETSPEKMVALNLKFPEDYGAEELAGEEVVFHVYVSWIVQYDVPEYNEKFIKETMKFEPTTSDVIGEHRAYIKKLLESNFAEAKSQEIESTIWETLYKSAKIEKYPESEVTYFYDSYCEDLKEAMTSYNYYYNYGFTDIESFARWYFGLDANGDWKAVVKEEAEKAVAQTLIYHAIAQQCGIQLTDADVEAGINDYIEMYKSSGKNYSREEVIELLGETTIKEGILYEKIVSYIKERAVVTYK